ncbi:MAG: DNA primase, partial [Lachnospiraceae bacterium]|nr:DNA primase [Lachnospiraceae bacterium]
SYFGLCPFHNEKTPSFCVTPSKQIYHCFGCGVGGNVLSFVMEYENLSFPEAVKMLAERAGMSVPEDRITPAARAEKDLRAELLRAHKDAAVFYVNVLRSEAGKAGLTYLRRRGLTDETILHFGLGYSSTRPDALYRYLRKKGYSDDILKETGLVLLSEKGGRDRFWNRVMFPIMDSQNRVIAFGGRVMGDAEPKYLNSQGTKIFDKSRNLYGLNFARKSREKFLLCCEGYMDVIAMHQAGFTNAVASLGTAFTSQHGMIMKRYTEEIVLCYDSDNAGRKAALRAIPILRESGLRIKVLDLTPYKDPDEFIKELGAEEFRKRIDNAQNAFLFEMNMMKAEFDFSDPDDKSNFFNKAAAQIAATFPGEIERNAYTETVAGHFGIDYGVLKKKVTQIAMTQAGVTEKEEWKPKSTRQNRSGVKTSGAFEAEKMVLTRLCEEPGLFARVASVLKPEHFSEGISRDVASALFEELTRTGKCEPGRIIDRFIDTEQHQKVAEIFSSTFGEEMEDRDLERSFREAVIRIRTEAADRAIRSCEDPAELGKLMAERRSISTLKF